MVATPNKPTLNTFISAYGQASATVAGSPLAAEDLRKMDAYWRAANYLAVGMIYLRDNPLLKKTSSPNKLSRDC